MKDKNWIEHIYESSSIQKYLSGRLTGLKILFMWIKMAFLPSTQQIKSLKNVHRGDTLFLIGTGPSLCVDDLNLLHENKCICMSVNKIYRLFDKTNWRPDYYFASDRELIEKYGDEIIALAKDDLPCIICNGTYMKTFREDAITFRLNAVNEVLKSSKSMYWRSKYKNGAFSEDASKYVYNSSTCVIAALQMAYYMGFSKVYLLGIDCGVKDNKVYASDMCLNIEFDEESSPFREMLEDFNAISESIKEKKLDFEVINVTRGGCLEAFTRMKLEESVKRSKAF